MKKIKDAYKSLLKNLIGMSQDKKEIKLLMIDIIKYSIILSITSIIALSIGKYIASTYGTDRFKYEYFYVAIINFIIGYAVFDIGVSKNKLAKIIAFLGLYLLLYVSIATELLPMRPGGIKGYYSTSYIVISIRYLILLIVFSLTLGSYYIKNKGRYVIGFVLLIMLIYFINLRVRIGFFTDITLIPLAILLLLPALLAMKKEGEDKYQFLHKIFLPYMATAIAFIILRPTVLTASDYVIEPCGVSGASLIFLYSHYAIVKYRKKEPYSFYKILLTVFLLVLIIRSFLTIMRAGWV